MTWCPILLHAVLFGEADQFIDGGKSKAGDGICTAIIDGDPPCVPVGKCCAREDNIGYIPDTFIEFPWCHEIISGAIFDFPGFIQVQKRGADAVYVTVAGGKNAMVNQKPAFIGFNGCRAGTNLGALPCGKIALDGAEDKAVTSPEFQIL